MDALLIDTDVFSFLFKGDTRGEKYAPDIQGRDLCLSFMSVGELLRWALSHNWGESRRRSLDQALRRYIVLPYDAMMAETWAAIAVQRSKTGSPISCGDCWIAASAVRYGIPLVTHNAKHFAGIDRLRVISRG